MTLHLLPAGPTGSAYHHRAVAQGWFSSDHRAVGYIPLPMPTPLMRAACAWVGAGTTVPTSHQGR